MVLTPSTRQSADARLEPRHASVQETDDEDGGAILERIGTSGMIKAGQD